MYFYKYDIMLETHEELKIETASIKGIKGRDERGITELLFRRCSIEVKNVKYESQPLSSGDTS